MGIEGQKPRFTVIDGGRADEPRGLRRDLLEYGLSKQMLGQYIGKLITIPIVEARAPQKREMGGEG